MSAVSRMPRASSARNSDGSPLVQWADSAGSTAVMTDTAKIAWGSENRTNALKYAE